MSKWSNHISHKETACKCGCGLNRMSDEIIDRAEVARAMVNVCYYGWTPDGWNHKPEIKLHITSGTRCKAHNDSKDVGGAKNSEHIVHTAPCSTCNSTGTLPGFPQRICYTCMGTGIVPINDSKALDGYFYYESNGKHIRVDSSDVLIYMWEMGLINGLVLYNNYRFHISTGRRYSSWKDKRGEA